ncbi:DUF2203 domain-containing protein [Bacillus sp. RAR_GA_16]|uniref:DUF2203 domain-containing protein n=1 Tax=Bacillus sp. RAR_GA_16 TaxID=2876774 RepID=UPI001CCAD708|nr:DUF2203 domain-containing protein [Bacillus sp. RAR_GA_16]MCA0174143.1 DUF2203 domain-containing protein [Bacillus sp. RAR_GA_16]
MDKKYFTLEEANGLLPVIKRELAGLKRLKAQFSEHYDQIEQHKKTLLYRHKTKVDEDILFKKEARMEFMELEAQTFINNIMALGVEIKNVDEGLIDFPAIINGKKVLLCWKEGENEVSFYHSDLGGFSQREPIENIMKEEEEQG